MEKTCTSGCPCQYCYQGSGSIGYGCKYDGYCDYQLPRDSREAPAPVDVRGEISSIVVDIYRTGYSQKNGEQQASDYVKNKIDQLLILYPHLSQPKVNVEEITKIVEQEMLPFAEGEWRKDFPKDSWEWGEKELKMLAKQIGRVVANFLNKGGNNG